MESLHNDDYSPDSLTSGESVDNNFNVDLDELVDDLQELQVSDEFSNEDPMDTDFMRESHTVYNGFISISPNNTIPIAVFRSFFTKEAFSRRKVFHEGRFFTKEGFSRRKVFHEGRFFTKEGFSRRKVFHEGRFFTKEAFSRKKLLT